MTYPNDTRSPIDPIDPRSPLDRDNRLHNDPVLDDRRGSGSRMALMALAVLAVLGMVLYGMNAGGPDTASTRATNPPATASTQRPVTPTGSTPTTATPAGENTGTAPRPATTR